MELRNKRIVRGLEGMNPYKNIQNWMDPDKGNPGIQLLTEK
jgi:hypothetical protein